MASRTILCIAIVALACSRAPSLEREFGDTEFSSSVWRNGRKEARGKMVASLIKSQLKNGATEAQFLSILGAPDCDGYEGALCYVFTSDNKTYQVEFPVDRSVSPAQMGGAEIHKAGEGVRSITVRSVSVPANTR